MPYTRNIHGQPRLSGKRVLIVEDEPLVAMDLEAMLEDSGAEIVGPATTLAGAIALATTETIDAAVLDVNLRGEDVLPAAEILAKRGVAILFQTGHGKPAELLARFPGSLVCLKPVTPEEIVGGVETLSRTPS